MIDPVERPEYGSLSAVPVAAPEPRRRPWLSWLITAATVAFALGLLANPWFERGVRSYIPGAASGAPSESATVAALRSRIDALEAARGAAPAPGAPLATSDAQVANQLDDVEDAQASVEQRLSNLQAQVAELRARTEASLGVVTQGAERAQTVLLVTALRRSLDAGARLDAYEPALRARFGRTHPAETAALLALGRAPVTPERLAADLARRSATIERASLDGAGWWQQLRQNLAGVVSVQRAGEAAADPSARLRFAVRQCEAGNVDAALNAVAALPPPARRAAAGWIAEARRYAAGTRALAALEVAAMAPVPPAQPTTL